MYRAKLNRLAQFCYQHMVRKITELSELEEVLNWLKAIQIQLRQCPQI
ncbi:MAG: hypothetical protein ACETWT_04070 [Thermodesulfobacteriota bacterium]